MVAEPEKLLKTFRLRSTPSRQQILDILLDNDYALSFGDIEKAVSGSSDRVTVYRTLKTFLDKGIIHKVLDDEGSLKYALCSDACQVSSHHHDHVHFKCTSCGQTSCMNVAIPPVKLEPGYKAKEFNLLIQGICPACK